MGTTKETRSVKCALHPNYAAKRPPTSTREGCVCTVVYESVNGSRSLLKPRTAADLFDALGDGSTTPMPPDEACKQLVELCKGNDKKGRTGPGRVSQGTAIKWLRDDYGWSGRGATALDSVCRRLGRTSYAKP